MFQIFSQQERAGGTAEGKTAKWRDGVYLATVNNSFEADILVSKLAAEHIPSEKKYIGSANYLEIVFGNNLSGAIELYVPEECLEDARNIIVPVDLDDCEPEDFGGGSDDE